MSKADLLDKAIDVYLNALKGLENFISQPSAGYNLSFEQYLILQSIVDRPGIKMMDIARERQVTRSAVSHQLRVLIKHEYVRQQQDPVDRRRLALRPTPKGSAVAQQIRQKIEKRFNRWVDVYGERRGATLLKLLDEFNQQVIQPQSKDDRQKEESTK